MCRLFRYAIEVKESGIQRSEVVSSFMWACVIVTSFHS